MNRQIQHLMLVLCVLAYGVIVPAAIGMQDTDDPAVVGQRKNESIEDQQKRILRNYAELETKFLALHEFEKENNPARSRLLKRAYELSQEQGTNDELKQIVALLTSGELRDAESNQAKVLDNMKRLLTLLQSEDRGKRIQDELKRNQGYLKEVERLLRIQKSIRGETEGRAETPRVSKSQKQTADRAKKLADKIRRNEEQSKEDAESSETPGKRGSGDVPSGNPGQGNAQQGEGSDGQPSEEEVNPVRKRVAAAEERMRNAKRKLDQAKRKQSIDEMNQAIRELEAAKKELEEILRQLREEEVERSLSMLESRFRKMLEREIKVRDQTKSLNAVPLEQRLADFEIKAGKLSSEQSSIATEASRALLLLREDGSSVAFPEIVEEMKLDMDQVASRLTASKVGEMTIGLENDIIETLGDLVQALARAQKENEAGRNGKQNGSGSGRPGESSLVGKISEIRMLRALQDRIFRRHTRYSKLLEDPGDPVGYSNDPDIRSALRRLTAKQKQLTEITKEIIESMNE